MKKHDLIKQLTQTQLVQSLLLTHGLFILLSGVLSILFFDHMSIWLQLFRFEVVEILKYGVMPALLVVLLDVIFIRILPKHLYDDGGVNAFIFKDRSIGFIVGISFSVAFAEELLFRGAIQTITGFVIASIIFALVHVRYLNKPFLLISVLAKSFLLGYLFLVTENLFVTITAHFLIDCLLGFIIRFDKEVT